MLIKEFDLDLETISEEFYHIEEIIVNDIDRTQDINYDVHGGHVGIGCVNQGLYE